MIHNPFLLFFRVSWSCGASQDECGEWVTALCPYGEDGCPDSQGDYDVIMAGPESDTDGIPYKVC